MGHKTVTLDQLRSVVSSAVARMLVEKHQPARAFADELGVPESAVTQALDAPGVLDALDEAAAYARQAGEVTVALAAWGEGAVILRCAELLKSGTELDVAELDTINKIQRRVLGAAQARELAQRDDGIRLTININDLPGAAEALAAPPVDVVPTRVTIEDLPDAPEPRYGSSDESWKPAEPNGTATLDGLSIVFDEPQEDAE